MNSNQLKERLLTAFPGSQVEVIDQTGSEDHYEVRIISAAFEGLSRIQQKQKVMAAVDAELTSGEIHAFSIFTGLPVAASIS